MPNSRNDAAWVNDKPDTPGPRAEIRRIQRNLDASSEADIGAIAAELGYDATGFVTFLTDCLNGERNGRPVDGRTAMMAAQTLARLTGRLKSGTHVDNSQHIHLHGLDSADLAALLPATPRGGRVPNLRGGGGLDGTPTPQNKLTSSAKPDTPAVSDEAESADDE